MKQNLLLGLFVVVIMATHLIAYPHHGAYQIRDFLLGPTPIAVAQDCPGDPATVITIEIKDAGFVPSRLKAKVCDEVRFVNVGAKQHEPAVGPHPDHEVYPEFDAKNPLQPGEVFKFFLVRQGSYSFHDHLNVNLSGSIGISGN